MKERERKQDALVSICLDRGKREKPQNGSEKKKSRHQRALSTTTQTTPPPANERRSRAKTLRVSSKSARSVRVPPSRRETGAERNVIIFARRFPRVRVKSAAFPKREKERTGALKSRLCLLCERAFSSFSLDSNESEILLSRIFA
jgi:hypothetical protein